MTKCRILALLLALFMLIALFAGCAADEGKTDDKKDDSASTGNDASTDDKKDDPAETEKPHIEYLGAQGSSSTATAQEAKDKEFGTYVRLMEIVTDEYNLDYAWSTVDTEAYLTTLSGLIAANDLPDVFNSREILDDSTLNNLILAGRLAAIDDILEYSDGSAKQYYNTEGEMLYLKAFATVSDGNWYYVPLANTTASSFDYSNSKYHTRANGQIHGAYSVCVRQDWLDKLGLAMPTTTDEFYDMLVAFQENDVNGSGAAEERYIGNLGSNFQTSGVGQWFGLPYTDFVEDPHSGVIEVACLTDGYKEFCDYMAKLYSSNFVYVEGTHPWGNATPIGANEVAAIGMMPGNLQFWETGDPASMYYPMPIVKAVEDVEPRLLIQESQAPFVGFSFDVGCDYQGAAILMDFLCCKEAYMLFKHGVEGKAYEWNDDGSITNLVIDNEDELYSNGAGQTYWINQNAFPMCGGGHANMWGVVQNVYDDAQAALDAGEPYSQDFTTREEWLAKYQAIRTVPDDAVHGAELMFKYIIEQGEDFYHPTAYYSYTTMATPEEAEVIATYGTELKTYLMEMTTSMITGAKSTDTIDEQVQFAYDNLGFQEYINAMQSRVNRYLVTIGRDPVEVE